MAERLALGIIPGTGWSAREIQMVVHEAEDAGFDAIFTTEVNNDALATAQLLGTATQRMLVGTWVANIYLRHPYVCAQGAALIADATEGRFILGLGVSHRGGPTGSRAFTLAWRSAGFCCKHQNV
ncbi:MAG: LLM class flavin-dependent oxidoreductase [Candidatus Tectomicrobia bacterium]|jgi:alkanesulfonate monooxygenase SsuD/methylene tetrahydromethanopterin reductase-like flavin-dependent oxidoreductase (luciferase family)|nr:LLM class flavin-dependent oxidoreductase [Candidatus Tectomicrobia bacterium]